MRENDTSSAYDRRRVMIKYNIAYTRITRRSLCSNSIRTSFHCLNTSVYIFCTAIVCAFALFYLIWLCVVYDAYRSGRLSGEPVLFSNDR